VGKRKFIDKPNDIALRSTDTKVRFVVYGVEMLDKPVNLCGKSGRIYLPAD